MLFALDPRITYTTPGGNICHHCPLELLFKRGRLKSQKDNYIRFISEDRAQIEMALELPFKQGTHTIKLHFEVTI